ncbi:DUF927 domain-containing protein [Proteiniclasticum ruminis]|uniref:DUF927 domain-containing protein n=1 Tax=Proteiniclasticum ruminis TaxID=398199 RepID=A0A1G8TFD9_9CLOT|nr:DUF927 domain-containing protein [Proteiniclasticum ruminis]SDJ40114.1 protein of unknown function [Proteiniclasticum ruminis]
MNAKKSKPQRISLRQNNRCTKLYAKDGNVYLTADKGEDKYCFRYIGVTKIYKNLITGQVEIELTYNDFGKTRQMNFPRSILTRQKIITVLPEHGIDVYEENSKAVLEWLLYTEETAPIEFYHTHLGWHKVNQNLVYLHNECISIEGLQSTYRGITDLGPKGSLKEYKNLLNEEVLGNLQLELACCIGLSAILVSYLKDYISNHLYTFHFYGDSSTGKSLAASCALSAYAKPTKAPDGLMHTYLDTNNGIFATLKNKHGICFCLDESSSRQRSDHTSLLYNVSEGRTKTRSTVEGDPREVQSFSGILTSTGENPLLERSSQANGLRVRVIELTFDQWTSSPENAMKIREGVSLNWGITAPILARYILEIGKEEVMQRFNDAKRIVMDKFIKSDKFLDRISDILAIVYLTSVLSKEAFDVQFDSDGVIGLLVESEMAKLDDRDLGQKFYECLLDYVVSHRSNIYVWEKDTHYAKLHPNLQQIVIPNLVDGRVDTVKGVPQSFAVRPSVIDEVVRKNNFASSRVVVKALDDKGYLTLEEYEGGVKNSVKRRLYKNALSSTRVYELPIQSDEMEKVQQFISTNEVIEKERQVKPKTGTVRKKRKGSILDSFFNEDIEGEE